MIPLMFINKPDNILVESTISITDMKPYYRNAGKLLEVEFKYNLDEYFQLRIILNEFDQPKYIYLRTNKVGDYVKVTPTQDEYVLDGNFVVTVLTYDDIMDIANNTISGERIEQWDIKAKMFNKDKDSKVYIDMIQYIEIMEQLKFQLNGKVYKYYVDKFMPVLVGDNKKIKPVYIYNYYYVYNITIEDEDYQIALIHPKAFKNHYLFRQTTLTHKLAFKNGTLKDASNNKYYFMNGAIIKNKERMSMQLFMNNIYKHEYKQYIFNAIRDRNLYTEIANAFNISKHHSLMAYDYTTDQRVNGRIKAEFIYNDNQIPELSIRMISPKDQFGNDYPNVFEFRVPIVNVFKAAELKTPYRLSDYGYFLKNGKYLPTANEMIKRELDPYLTASNNNVFVSVNREFLQFCIKDAIQTLMPSINVINDGIIINPVKKLKEINYEDRTITLQNITEYDVVSFDDLPSNDIITNKEVQTLSDEGVQELFGMNMKVPPLKVELSPVTPDQYDTYFLLVKHTEPLGYSYSKLEKEVYYFAASMKVTFIDKEFAFVYNYKQDKIYFIDLDNQDAAKTFDGVESMTLYFNSINETTMKHFLKESSLGKFIVKDGGFGIQVDTEKGIRPFIGYRTISGQLFSSIDGLDSDIGFSYGFRTRNNNLLALYNSNNKVVQEKFRGIFSTANTDITNVKVDDDGLYITYKFLNKEKTISITLEDGVFVYYDVYGNKKELDYKNVANTNMKYGVINAIYDTDTRSGIAFDVNIVKNYLDNKDLRINEELFVNDGQNCYLIKVNSEVKEHNLTVDVEYDKKAFIVTEEWYGKEVMCFIDITNEFNNEDYGDVIHHIDMYENDDIIVYKLPVFTAKNISLY